MCDSSLSLLIPRILGRFNLSQCGGITWGASFYLGSIGNIPGSIGNIPGSIGNIALRKAALLVVFGEGLSSDVNALPAVMLQVGGGKGQRAKGNGRGGRTDSIKQWWNIK